MSSKSDYLRFSANSIKELITRKLTADTKFTDQIYEGSNLAILIDIVSYMYQCLIYNVNNAAAESMFADTQIYENINRLCKFLGYNPKGAYVSVVDFMLDNNLQRADDTSKQKFEDITIPAYSYIDTGKTDRVGRKIYYSTSDSVTIDSDPNFKVLMYNGMWKLYPTVFSGTNQKYQTLILDGIVSDSTKNRYVQNNMIHVYVDDGNIINRWKAVDDGIFTDNDIMTTANIYQPNSEIYNVRLNEKKQYEVTFGNGFVGKMPPLNSSIYVFYLDSNGEDAYLEQLEVTNAKINHSSQTFGIPESLYSRIFQVTTSENTVNTSQTFDKLANEGIWHNSNSSTMSQDEQTVDEIRTSAPEWFKIGNRLVTKNDWEYFVKNRFKDFVLDVKCQNNWEYISTFYRWLYNIGIRQHNNPNYYLNQSTIIKHAKYSDASDTNNVYLWIKTHNDSDIYSTLLDTDIQPIKMLTQEPTYLKPLIVNFAISAQDVESAQFQYFNDDNDTTEFDPDNQSWLEITINDNAIHTTNDINLKVANVIKDYFKEENMHLGQVIDYSKLTTQILDIGNILRIRTVYRSNKTSEERIINGIAFATWTNSFINLGDDLSISNTTISLEDFQFPRLYKANTIQNKIKIIKKSMSDINMIQY